MKNKAAEQEGQGATHYCRNGTGKGKDRCAVQCANCGEWNKIIEEKCNPTPSQPSGTGEEKVVKADYSHHELDMDLVKEYGMDIESDNAILRKLMGNVQMDTDVSNVSKLTPLSARAEPFDTKEDISKNSQNNPQASPPSSPSAGHRDSEEGNSFPEFKIPPPPEQKYSEESQRELDKSDMLTCYIQALKRRNKRLHKLERSGHEQYLKRQELEHEIKELKELNKHHAQLAATRFSECVDYQEKIKELTEQLKMK